MPVCSRLRTAVRRVRNTLFGSRPTAAFCLSRVLAGCYVWCYEELDDDERDDDDERRLFLVLRCLRSCRRDFLDDLVLRLWSCEDFLRFLSSRACFSARRRLCVLRSASLLASSARASTSGLASASPAVVVA